MSIRRVLCISPHHSTLAVTSEAIRAAGHEVVTTATHPVAAMLEGVHAVVIDCETQHIAEILASIRAVGSNLPVIGIGTRETCLESTDFVIPSDQANLLGFVISSIVPEPT